MMLGFSSRSWAYFSFAVIYCSELILFAICDIRFPRMKRLKLAEVKETEHNASNLS